MPLSSVLAAAVAGMSACTDSKAIVEPEPLDVAGCYQLTLGPWVGPPRDSWDPASHFELSRDPHPDWEGAMSVKPTITEDLGYPWGLWQQPQGDSIVVTFSSGYVGTRLHLKYVGNSRWRGTAQAWTDTPTPMPSATASLHRTACPD